MSFHEIVLSSEEEAVKLDFWHPNQYQIYINQTHVKNKNKSIIVDIIKPDFMKFMKIKRLKSSGVALCNL